MLLKLLAHYANYLCVHHQMTLNLSQYTLYSIGYLVLGGVAVGRGFKPQSDLELFSTQIINTF
jgi:hypothetical protein